MAKPQDKMKSLLGDLGKPTLRGVRKCPKCGTYNGTRGISCKNKFCDVVFKEKDKKKANSTEAVKIVTGSTVQVFSVRLRDRGPDYRGFVQLPLVQDQDGNPATIVNPEVISSAARCYVENCQRNLSHNDPACPHIKAAIDCNKEAQPLTLKNSVLNSLQVSSEIKQAIWLLATETTGPLVQRVTRNIMVVKCKPNPKQPLGFLHFSFFESNKGKQSIHKFQCSCKSFKQRNVSGDEYKRCVHYYACVCALNSDDKLLHEFSAYLDLENIAAPVNNSLIELAPASPEHQLVTVYQTQGDIEIHELPTDPDTNTLEVVVAAEAELESPNKKRRKEEIEHQLVTVYQTPGDIEIHELPTDPDTNTLEVVVAAEAELESPNKKRRKEEIEHQLVTVYQTPGDIEIHELPTEPDTNTLEVVVAAEAELESPNKKRRKEEIVQASSALLTLQEANNKTGKSVTPGKTAGYRNPVPNVLVSAKKNNSQQAVSETEVISTFQSWLASVTERINQTMHYQFDGNPDPLVFHAPQYFFDCLQQRISYGNKKKRLPNFTTAFVRKDALPLGTFTKYTWHITNIIHVKQIFDTDEMALEITRNFIENRDSTYDLYEVPKFDPELDKNQTPIRPSELKTYLMVGNTSPDQKEPTPFIIEWIPDILPKSHIGELRIKFEYGHHRNGFIEHRRPITTSEPIQTEDIVSVAAEHITYPIT